MMNLFSQGVFPANLQAKQESDLAQKILVVGENVTGILSLENGKPFERICASLESEGYTVQPFIIPACAVQADHKRERVWILAYAQRSGSQKSLQRFREINHLCAKTPKNISGLADIKRTPITRSSGDLRKGNGVPNWVDRIRGLGNAVVPQLVFEIYQAIEKIR